MSSTIGREAVRAKVQPGMQAGLSPAVARAAVVGAVLAGAVVAFASTVGEEGAAVAAAGAELTRLLRAMAGLKLLMAAGVAGGIYWRLGVAAPGWRVAGYVLAAAGLGAGPALIWTMGHVGPGALLLHGGLFGGVLALWRDPVVGERLAAAVRARRA